jgi:hypothetical protein
MSRPARIPDRGDIGEGTPLRLAVTAAASQAPLPCSRAERLAERLAEKELT